MFFLRCYRFLASAPTRLTTCIASVPIVSAQAGDEVDAVDAEAEGAGGTRLQFAFSLGDAAMTEFLIHERAIVQWQWGPLVSLAIPLYEIDSAGPSPNDMMQACLP